MLPIELLNSFDLLANARVEYVDAIVDYNRSQFAMYVALGQPPANSLAHPVPVEGVSPRNLPPRSMPGPLAAGAPEKPQAPRADRPDCASGTNPAWLRTPMRSAALVQRMSPGRIDVRMGMRTNPCSAAQTKGTGDAFGCRRAIDAGCRCSS